MSLDPTSILLMAGLCLVVALSALWIFSNMGQGDERGIRQPEAAVAFLIDGEEIVDATAPGDLVLRDFDADGRRDWTALFRAFRARFPGLPATADAAFALAPTRIEAAEPGDDACLVLEPARGKLRIRLEDPHPLTAADRHLHLRQQDHLRNMDLVAEHFPYPVWLCADDGRFLWRNRAYFELMARTGETAARIAPFEFDLPEADSSRAERVVVEDGPAQASHWYNVTKTQTELGSTLGHAIDIDAVIAAETAQRKFVQTLTKTFAQLSTGLAIFDRERQLALFNPALVDLLDLPAEFLSARPTLLTFFDTLRDNRMMPEPKDYANWRQQITDLVIASVDGRYQETWTLPSGLTYRVTGRPHPDGAIALLFEDITAEMSLTRRFRWQINLGQSVIDTLDEAIAVFSSTGILTLSNRAFRKLWQVDPDTSFAEFTFRDALRQWQAQSVTGPFWARLRDYMAKPQERSEWYSDIAMKTGTGLECRVTPLAGGATLVGFRLRPVLEPAAREVESGGA